MKSEEHTLTRWFTAGPFTWARQPQKTRPPQAMCAADLNRALSGLHAAQGTYSKADFLKDILPIYQRLVVELVPELGHEGAEQAVITVMDKTAQACHRAARSVLPTGRLGTDYRQVEIEYVDALVTAMAVDCVRKTQGAEPEPPETIAARVLPAMVLNRLRAEPMVWEDWLGFFVQSPTGGLYALSCEPQLTLPDVQTVNASPGHTEPQISQPQKAKVAKVAKGWRVVEGIKACLADGTLSFNQPGDLVQVDAQGRTFLQTPEVFEAVKVLLCWEEGARKLENRFLRLNIHQSAPGGFKRFRGKTLQSERRVQGYVVEDSHLFWGASVPEGRFIVQDLTSRV